MTKNLNLSEKRSIVTSAFTNDGSENTKNSSKEVWKDIIGYEGKYQISSYGRVKSLYYHNAKGVKRTGFLKFAIDDKGYLRCALSINNKLTTFKVHRLVAIHFIPNINNYPQVNHIDGDKMNNHVDNLEWCDNSKNQIHAWSHKLNKGRTRCGKRVQVISPNGDILQFNTIRETAKYFQVCEETIRYIKNNGCNSKLIPNKYKFIFSNEIR